MNGKEWETVKVDLKEHLERIITERDKRVDDRFVAGEKAVVAALAATDKQNAAAFAAAEKQTAAAFASTEKAIEIKSAAEKIALDLQFNDTQRRLRELNGHHDEIKMNQGNSVTKDKFDDLVNGDIADLKKFRDTSLGRQSVIAIVISGIMMLLGMVAQKFFFK